ncbi:hypothetical protein B1A99_32845 [Cohnella sp. CIP 111063]|uniref:DUF2194 domain-containing protein n=1 Tax=unclassified Cohnella TaxID=2636738 RepID=UPI000B8C1123|nr:MULTISPECIES: DUF2194 domain-containing protein [unclassified Cohnella]OXS52645.1 hypothetical protein B1A99_32845 [Cohnella sp. CIP 111063]PRX59176.1 hypothetical protein B0G52_1324 [Cohnella sp. SGD-V74]
MDNNVKFRRNVYIILVGILAFGIISQIARSDLVLKYVSNNNPMSLAELREFEAANMLVTDESTSDAHCMVYDSLDELSVKYYDNFREVYRYIKQPYTIQDVAADEIRFESCRAVLLLNSIETMPDAVDELERYIAEGGYLFMTRMDHPGPVFTRIYRKIGIVNYRYVIGNNDIEFTSNVLIGQKNQKFADDHFYNDSLSVELDHSSEMLAKGDLSPIIWRYEYGDGAVMVYNGNNLFTKSNRGLIVGALSMLIRDYIYPIFNAKLFYIDDYPAPLSKAIDLGIYADYKRNIASFFKDIWWPDMIRAANRYDLKYTAVAIQDYNEVVAAPLPAYRQEDLTNLIVYGREVLKTGGEIGIHGYNHQPLQFREDIAKEYDYKTWSSYEDIETSVQTVVAFLKKAFPSYDTVSYVPPSNVLSEQGRKALADNWDSLRVIASLYEDDPRGFSYVQEFEIAPDGIVEMPRITSGYSEAPDMLWLEASVMTAHGYFSHFIHPDDLLDEHRGKKKGWKNLYQDFGNLLDRISDTYPWLKAQTSGDAAMHVAAVLNSRITRKQSEEKLAVDIENYRTKQYFILRTDKKIGKLTHCHVQLIDENTYLVEATNAHFNIELK